MTLHDLVPRRLCGDLSLQPLGIGSGTSRWDPSASCLDDGRMLDGLRRAVESGVDLVDTADWYGSGHAERLIGKVLREFPGHTVHVASKVGHVRGSAAHPYAGPRLRHQLEQTLENLYLDALAIYTLDSYDFGLGDQYLDPVIAQMQAMRDLGQIRAIGLRGPGSRGSVRLMRRFRELFERIKPDVVWTQANGLLPLAVLEDGEDLGAFTARQGAGLVVASPLAHGALAGGRPARAQSTLGGRSMADADVATLVITQGLEELAVRFGGAPGTLVRLALRFSLQTIANAVVIVGVGDERQVETCLSCLGDPLSDQELLEVADVFSRIRTGLQDPAGGIPAAEANV
ncbi:aldo/keto reductase [Streptomyces sp. NPDC001389]|uniref:aldo/keto reductase n=1 Tax=Streptomyces sp. NPDC001389 TaxID=3364569 RepID=UPI00368369A5